MKPYLPILSAIGGAISGAALGITFLAVTGITSPVPAPEPAAAAPVGDAELQAREIEARLNAPPIVPVEMADMPMAELADLAGLPEEPQVVGGWVALDGSATEDYNSDGSYSFVARAGQIRGRWQMDHGDLVVRTPAQGTQRYILAFTPDGRMYHISNTGNVYGWRRR